MLSEVVLRSSIWFGGEPLASNAAAWGVSFQHENGYFGLVARPSDTLLPSVCEMKPESDDSRESDSHSSKSHGSHSRGSHSRGSHSRDSSSHESHSRGSTGSESKGRGSRGRDSRSQSESEEDFFDLWNFRSSGHRRGPAHRKGPRGHDRTQPGRSHHRFPDYNQDPYSPYSPKPKLPSSCPQPHHTTTEPTPQSTTSQTTTRQDSSTEQSTAESATTLSTTREPLSTTTELDTTEATSMETTSLDDTTSTSPVTTTTTAGPCPPGWLSFRDSCYKVHSRCGQPRKEAEKTCERYGGHLATIHNQVSDWN